MQRRASFSFVLSLVAASLVLFGLALLQR